MKTVKTVLSFILLGLVLNACGSDDSQEEEEQIEETTLEGEYRGSWTSVTETTSFTGVPVSARFAFASNSETRLLGEFFISSNFTSCCESGPNDGSLTMEIDGATITSFRYNDIIPNCGGTFNGTGTISSSEVLEIAFTGNDCDGNHVGTITLSKI